MNSCHSVLSFSMNRIQGPWCTMLSTHIFSRARRWSLGDQNNTGDKIVTSKVLGLTIEPWIDWSRSRRAPLWPYKLINWLLTNVLINIPQRVNTRQLTEITHHSTWRFPKTVSTTPLIQILDWPITQAGYPECLPGPAVYEIIVQWSIPQKRKNYSVCVSTGSTSSYFVPCSRGPLMCGMLACLIRLQ